MLASFLESDERLWWLCVQLHQSVSRWRKCIDRESRSDQSSCITQIMVQSIKEYVHSSVSIRAHDVCSEIHSGPFQIDCFKTVCTNNSFKKIESVIQKDEKTWTNKRYDPEYECTCLTAYTILFFLQSERIESERFHQIFQTSVTGDTYADFTLALTARPPQER